MSQSFKASAFEKIPVVGILRGTSLEESHFIASTYQQQGFYTLEVTMNTPMVEEIIITLSEEYPELCIGAGTVCSVSDLDKAIAAGARFIVTPILNDAVIRACVEANIAVFPGAYTPTEIYQAWQLGATAVKVFPATQLGPSYLKNVLAPLNSLKLIPTGGVSLDNLKSYFRAGAYGVGMGSSLLQKQYISDKDSEGLGQHFLTIKEEIQRI